MSDFATPLEFVHIFPENVAGTQGGNKVVKFIFLGAAVLFFGIIFVAHQTVTVVDMMPIQSAGRTFLTFQCSHSHLKSM